MELKKRNLKVLLLFIVLMFFSLNLYKVNAGVSSSDPTVTSGGTVSITISSSPAAQAYKISLASSGGLTFKSATSTAGYAKGSTVNGSSTSGVTTLATYTFTAPKVTSTTKYTVQFTVSASSDGETFDIASNKSNTSTVTVKPASSSSSSSSSSKNSSSSSSSSSSSTATTASTTSSAPTLTNLGINPYDFSGFSASKTSYSVTVPNDCTSVTIYATAGSGVSISGTGTVSLKVGTNKYNVTASNSKGSTTYTLSIVRKSEEGEIVPNVIDDEESESEGGIGLDSLAITGYELDSEFALNKYEYTITVKEKITEKLLEEIKDKIKWTVNYDEVDVDFEIEVINDEKGLITIYVRDDEREYSKYTINVIYESDEEEAAETAVNSNSNNNKPQDPDEEPGFWERIKDISYRTWIEIACILIITGIAMYHSISSYVKYKKYEENDLDEDFNDDEDRENIVEQMAKDRGYGTGSEDEAESYLSSEDIPDAVKEMKKDKSIDEKDALDEFDKDVSGNIDDVALTGQEEKKNLDDKTKDLEEKYVDLGGYRKPRRGSKSNGKH